MKYNYKKICLSLIITAVTMFALNSIPKEVMAKVTSSAPSKNLQISAPGRDKFFITKEIGWKAEYDALGMMKEEMILYKTINGGRTWTLIADTNKLKTIPVSGNKTGMSFISKTKGWIAANAPWEGKIGLLTTDDGGVTWHDQKLIIPAKFKHGEIISYPPLVLSPSDGLLITFPYVNDNNPHLLIYTTHNGGKTWLPFADKTSGSSKGISWKALDKAQKTLSLNYQNTTWTFDGDKWLKQTK